MDTLSGSVERITFYNPDNGYSVVRLRPANNRSPGRDREGLVTIVGNLPDLSPGEHVQLTGRWLNHPKHGQQFQVEVCEKTLPATVAGIQRYLGSGLVRGIGPRLAERIVENLGQRTLQVIEEEPHLLLQVPDIGPKRLARICAAWQEQKQIKEIMLFLHSHNISTNLAVKIYKRYGDQALAVVKSDPYRLAQDIYGIGFKTSDRIAQALGLAIDHPSRLEAGVLFVLNQASEDGHVYLPQDELVEGSANMLEVAQELIIPAVERLAQHERIQREALPFNAVEPKPQVKRIAKISEDHPAYGETAVYLSPYYFGEKGVAENLRKLSAAWPTRLSDVPPSFIVIDPALSPEQQQAIRSAISNPISVLTGGPGTGKTTTLKAFIHALEGAGKRYALASPTGRAAKRLSQATGRPASTLHRLLGFTPGEGFKHNSDNPLALDMLVIDEASMLDLYLAHHLLKALEPGTHLLLVGDVDQLPSVGAGDVLRDVIASGIAPVTRLSIIFRQAAHSSIVTNAHRINQGKMPHFERPAGGELGDFYLVSVETPEQAADSVEELVCNRIPARFGLHPRHEIQVLAPMYRGIAGVTSLNERLQARLNPPEARGVEKRLFGQLFRPGDKLMQLQNNYDKDVFNGDIGVLYFIDMVEQALTVDFDGRAVTYDWSEADQLTLAYAVSVHKAQGSEFEAVVIPLVTQHYMMLQRNLLYTAVTRARKLCVLVGNQRAIGMAVNNNRVVKRYTALDWRLRS